MIKDQASVEADQASQLQQRIRHLLNENEQLQQYRQAMLTKIEALQFRLDRSDDALRQHFQEVSVLTAMLHDEQTLSAGQASELEVANAEKNAMELALAECLQHGSEKEQQWASERKALIKQMVRQQCELERQARELGQLARQALASGNKSASG
ncbi:hypothetical protein [Nitrincola sp. MINF-07-Sa-05]|uniref:hypothetical protein n=1 Tax=Nitrincola salilacus TaxID=3400273 RepID=UPI0039184E9A